MCCTVVEHEIWSLKRFPSRHAVGLEVYLSKERMSISADCPKKVIDDTIWGMSRPLLKMWGDEAPAHVRPIRRHAAEAPRDRSISPATRRPSTRMSPIVTRLPRSR